eukprot:1482678-Pleurochrysis_carterae.AAC.1
MMLRIARSATPLSWWTCGGQKFSGVVAVQRSHYTGGRVASFVEQSCESGQESSNVSRRFAFVTQQVHCLEPRVVVDDHQSIAAPAIYRRKEGSGDVYVDQPSGVRRLVQVVRVWQSSRIRLGASGARRRQSIA